MLHAGCNAMTTFTMHLQSSTQYEKLDNITSFVGEDTSGQFGILANHARMMACLKYGMSRFRYDNEETEYLALPGGVVYFVDNQLYVSTRHYLRSKDYQTIETALEENLRAEEENLNSIRESLRRLDEEIFNRLLKLRRGGQYEF